MYLSPQGRELSIILAGQPVKRALVHSTIAIGMSNGRCRMHGGPWTGAPKGNRNAWKHGRFSAEAIARRREVSDLLRTVRELLNENM
jgi:hypothetical protein